MGGFFVEPDHYDDCCEPPFVPTPLLFDRRLFFPGIRSFPRRAWSADFTGLVVVGEFARHDWYDLISVDPPPEGEKAVRGEIDALMALFESEREKRMPEIMAQDNDLQDYFLRLLMMSKTSHPATFDLIKVAERLSEMLMSFYKAKFNRPRPYQFSPALQPLMRLPGHPAYPSGHAMSCHLIAFCLGAAVEDEGIQRALTALAERIGHNREIAGLHYESDTLAGQSIARQAFEKVLPRCRSFQAILDEARGEWRSATRPDPSLAPDGAPPPAGR